jgi:hypothetical protein
LDLADGSVHGKAAYHIALSAMLCIKSRLFHECAGIFFLCHEQLINSRRWVLAIVVIDLTTNVMRLGSIGNILTILLSKDNYFHAHGARGIVCAASLELDPVQISLAAGNMLVMFSDGVDEGGNIRKCQDVENRLPQKLTEEVARWGTAAEDASVVVYCHDLVNTGTL